VRATLLRLTLNATIPSPLHAFKVCIRTTWTYDYEEVMVAWQQFPEHTTLNLVLTTAALNQVLGGQKFLSLNVVYLLNKNFLNLKNDMLFIQDFTKDQKKLHYVWEH
jgi:hypothetical protein